MHPAASDVNDESSASIKRSLAMVHQTNQVGADTMLELDKQGRQIEKMERDVETIEDNNKQAERHIRGLRTIFGSIANKFSKNKSYREETEVVPRETPQTVKNQAVASRSVSSPAGTTTTTTKNQGVKSSQLLQGNDAETERMRQQMDEQDADLDELSGALHNMMGMATDMNREITDQNQRLEKVSAGVDKQNKTIEKNNRAVKKML
jgi:chromosome segregation ATPase